MLRNLPKHVFIALAVIVFTAYAVIVFAAAPSGGYTSGQTLDPDCIPGSSADCVVRQPWLINTADGYVYNTDSMVGIGTDTPTVTLDVVGDVAFDTTVSGAHLRSVQGDLGSLGGDRGMFQYVGDDMSLLGTAMLDYSSGDPSYNLYLTNGVHALSFSMGSATGEATMNASKISLNSESSISTDRQSFIAVDTNGNAPGEPNASLFATADDAVTFSNISANSDSALMFVSTLSTENAASGTPLVIQVSDENTRGGGFSARSRSLSYDYAGADMFVWDQALGGDRTWMWMDETKIDTGLLLNPLIPGAANYTTNNITEISFEYHNGDPTLSNNSLYKINADFIWSKPATLGEIMRLDGVTGRLSVFGNTASNYTASFFNDGNNANRFGLLVQAGQDSGSGTLIQFNDGDGTSVGSITFSGTNTSYGTSSDRRLKDNIVDTHYTLNDLMKIQVHDYTFKAENTGHVYTGFIAQELYDIFPDAVIAPTDGRMWSVDYGKVTPLLVKAIQELDMKAQSILALTNNGFIDSLRNWLSNTANGIGDFFARRVHTDELCVGATCLTESQLQEVLQSLNQSQTTTSNANENSSQNTVEEAHETENETPSNVETVDTQSQAPEPETSASDNSA
jgi:hypothetical protein